MKNGIFLDDERNPEDVYWLNYPKDINWAVVRSVDEFKKIINVMFYEFDNPQLDFVSFDSDLQDTAPKTEGKEAAKFLCEQCALFNLPLPTCFIHTQNPESADYILSILNSFNKIHGE